MTLAVIASWSLLRNGVAVDELLTFVAYWCVCVLLPGLLVSRWLLGSRPHVVDGLALGALTGVALEILTYLLLRAAGIQGLARWWFILPLGLFVAVPTLRQHWIVRHRKRVSLSWAWSMTALCSIVIMGTDRGWFQTNPLPPAGGSVHRDQWWHLAIVHELLRPGPAQVPQVAGETFTYHFNAHAHMAMASRISGVSPDLILFRLWLIPMVLIAAGLLALLAAEVARNRWAGPFAVWLSLIALGGGYLWSDLPILSASPLRIPSPSQMIAMPIAFGCAWALIRALRGHLPTGGWFWLGLTSLAAAGSKPTVVPILLAGSALTAAIFLIWKRTLPRPILLAPMLLLFAQLWSMVFRSDSASNPSITVLGTLKSTPIYREVTGDSTLRGVNDGLVLDSLNSASALVAAGAAVLWLIGSHAILLVGFTGLLHPAVRRDPVSWWLTGSMLGGWVVFLLLDLSSFGQLYFLHTSLPFGAVMTAWLVAVLVQTLQPREALQATLVGLGLGVMAALIATSITRAAGEMEGFGILWSVVLPVTLVLSLGALGLWMVQTWRLTARSASATFIVFLMFVVGIVVPNSVDASTRQLVRWLRPTTTASIDATQLEFVSAGEQEAALWLRANSADTDVIATNSHCQPPTDPAAQQCNAIGFWVGGLSGRRVVLEGWGYTVEAHAAHGVDGRHRNAQPPPWPDRFALSRAAFEDPSAAILDELRDRFDTTWLVGVRRAGPISEDLDVFADRVLDNGEVAIFRIRE